MIAKHDDPRCQAATSNTSLLSPSRDATVIELTRFRADLTRALARRANKLIEADDLAEQVAVLSPLEAYLLIKELGVDEATQLLAHLSGEQWQACVDLDCWDKDSLSNLELDAWLAPFAELGVAELAHAFGSLDEEIQVLHLARTLTVYDKRSEEIPVTEPVAQPAWDSTLPVMDTPDGFFVVEQRQQAQGCEPEVDPFVLVKALYEHDLHEGMRLLMAAKWESQDALTEQAYAFRCARLQDMGFYDRPEAARIFAKPPATPPAVVSTLSTLDSNSHLPALYASVLQSDGFFVAGLSRLDDPVILARIQSEWVYLVNAAVVAFGESPKNLDHMLQIGGWVRDTVSLGLETVLRRTNRAPTADAFAELLERWPLVHLFGHGHHSLQPLRHIAQQWLRDPVVRIWLEQVDGGEHSAEHTRQAVCERAFLIHLAKQQPLWIRIGAHENQGGQAPQPVAFSSNQEVQQAQAELQGLIDRIV